ncbi:MAG: hypothetical protein GX660_10080 [Clostridiaceae bacterium]|nr:hypothetical protein [Clostridiaceae bacterium]
MKIICLLCFYIISSSYFSYAQCYDYYTTVQTPTGEDVEAIFRCEFNANNLANAEDQAADWLVDHSSDAKRIGPASRQYNCHSYAWHVSTGGNKVWINSLDYYGNTNVDEYFSGSSPSYESATQSTASKAFYGYSADHSAYVTGVSTVFMSKWGAWPLYIHDWNDCPYSSSSISYYKRSCNTIILKDIVISSDLTIDDCNVQIDNVTIQNNANVEIEAQSFQADKDFYTSVGVILNIHP